jgi:hypothetical protein
MPEGIGPRDYILDESGRDITPRSKRRLGDYLSSRTRGGAESFTPPVQGGGDYTYMPPRPNAFPVAEGTTEIPADASRESPGAFAPDLGSSTNSQDLRSVVTVVPSAERSTNGGVSGHEAVNSQKARSAADSVLGSNRFTSRGKFTSRSFASATPESPATFTGQGPDTGKNVFESMRKAALTSMLNAAGGVAGPGGGLATMSGIDGIESADLKNLEGGLSRIGVPTFASGLNSRVRTEALRPAGDRSRLASPTPLEFEDAQPGDDAAADISPGASFDQSDISGASPTRYNATTYGQLNSYLQNFSGAGTLRTAGLALLAYGVLFIASAVVALIISLIVNRMPRPDPTTDVLPLGSERGADFGRSLLSGIDVNSGPSTFLQSLGGLIAKVLGVMQPYDGDIGLVQYFLASLEGSAAILGIDTNDITTAGNAIINIGTTPGYYLTLVREISRDLSLLSSDSVAESGLLGILEGFRSSKLVRFVDVCARLGIVNGKAREADPDQVPDDAAGNKYPAGGDPSSPAGALVDAYKTAQLRVSRSRETNGSKRLAWSHTSLGYTRSELVTEGLVKSLGRQRMVTDGGIETGLSGLRSLRARKITSSTGRISPDDRAYHEKLLDSEYMPFYFHDVRTNEILSFHAFLSALSDSYNANYNSVDGFGRMDPVQIYKNTTRSISFSFVVVATGPDDHSQMWHSVNKLVNMIYPQWSEGDRLDTGNNVYTQPFSQTIAASPMVRVRIGDVIHSNYSRFALERIFGLELPKSKLETTAAGGATVGLELYEHPSDASAPDGDYKRIVGSTAAEASADGTSTSPVTTTDLANLNEVDTNVVENSILSLLQNNVAVKISTPIKVKLAPGKYTFGTQHGDIVGLTGKRKFRVGKEIFGNIVWYSEPKSKRKTVGNVIVKLDDAVKKEEFFGREVIEYGFLEASFEDVEVLGSFYSDGRLASALRLGANPPENSTVSVVDKFLDPVNNPVVRSFEEGSGGRGLAGFIQTLGLEYGDADNTWTVERGSRAPNMVKVSVTFLPIHDIPMGLSSDGTARAAAYPVGSVTRKRHFPGLVQNDIDMATALRKK